MLDIFGIAGLKEALETIFFSTAAVTAAEIGDKTQLLALVLAARFRKPLPIVLGILAATILNHAMAGAVGAALAHWLTPEILRWVLVVSFFAMAAWILVPDKIDDDEASMDTKSKYGVFATTCILFFLAEMGDKTQIATVAMAAHYQSAFLVVIGTTLGMLLADVPAVFVGDKLSQKISMKVCRWVAAVIFAGMGVAAMIWG
ncbi:MAG: TMEM165/GDT1 family protein [Duodenibacillus sp.]|nr:TMEM165/GDT1 family protein [Duodenibacillus sp.]